MNEPYTIIIRAQGPTRGDRIDIDAEPMLGTFRKRLEESGHQIDSAEIIVGTGSVGPSGDKRSLDELLKQLLELDEKCTTILELVPSALKKSGSKKGKAAPKKEPEPSPEKKEEGGDATPAGPNAEEVNPEAEGSDTAGSPEESKKEEGGDS